MNLERLQQFCLNELQEVFPPEEWADLKRMGPGDPTLHLLALYSAQASGNKRGVAAVGLLSRIHDHERAIARQAEDQAAYHFSRVALQLRTDELLSHFDVCEKRDELLNILLPDGDALYLSENRKD